MRRREELNERSFNSSFFLLLTCGSAAHKYSFQRNLKSFILLHLMKCLILSALAAIIGAFVHAISARIRVSDGPKRAEIQQESSENEHESGANQAKNRPNSKNRPKNACVQAHTTALGLGR